MPEEEDEGGYFYQPPVRLPYQILLEQLQACGTQDERERLLMRFSISQLPEPLRAAVQAAAVPRFFDRAFLNALLEQPLDEAQFAELTGLSYIEPYPGEGRFNVHERSRKLLQEKFWQEDEALYREISRRAFVYCDKQVLHREFFRRSFACHTKQGQKDTTWRIETVYHQLIAEPDNGAIVLNDTCVQWMSPPFFAYDKAESLLLAVREHLKMKRLPEKAAHYFLLNQARVDIRYARFNEAKKVLQRIPQSAIQDDRCLTVEYLESLGDVHLRLSEPQEGRLRYEEAFLLHQKSGNRMGEANCLLYLGHAHLHYSELPEAQRKIEKALVLYRKLSSLRGEADCLKSLGHIHLGFSEYTDARRHYEAALLLYRKIDSKLGEADCLLRLGEVHFCLSELSEAQNHYGLALALYRTIGTRLGEAGCIKFFGHIQLKLSNIPEAQLYYENALTLYRKIGSLRGEASCLRSFGKIALLTGAWIVAKQYYEQAAVICEHIQYRNGVAECLEGFAKLHQAQNQLPQAEEYWQKAATMYRQLAMPLRAEQCLEQLRQMKEQNQSAYVRHDVSDK